MNVWLTNRFERLPGRAHSVRQAFKRLDKRARLIVMAVAGAAVLGVVLYLLFGGTAKRKMPPPPVIVAATVLRNVTLVEHTVGTVVANSVVQVTARVSGQLLSADFEEGQTVRAGDLLFQIDPKPFVAAVQQARAQMAKDSAQFAIARNDKNRYETLFAQNAASSQQRDQADATSKSLAATVAADRAALDVAELNLGYTQIRSPIDGKTGPILVHPGNLVSANGTSPLVVVAQIQPVKVSFSLPQSDLPQIQARARQHALSAAIDMHGTQLTAPVDFIGNEVDDKTGTIELRASFDNRDQRLVPGQMIDVTVALNSLKNATVVPREAVNEGPDGRYVYVVGSDNLADMRPVKVLFDDGTNMAVSGGVKRGEKVIVDGQLRVEPGKAVGIVQARAMGAKAAADR